MYFDRLFDSFERDRLCLSFKVLLIFVFKCILFFILHVTVINYIYKKICWGLFLIVFMHCELLLARKPCHRVLLLICQDNCIQMCFPSARQTHHTLWLCLGECQYNSEGPKCVWVCACMCLHKRRRDVLCVFITLMGSGYLWSDLVRAWWVMINTHIHVHPVHGGSSSLHYKLKEVVKINLHTGLISGLFEILSQQRWSSQGNRWLVCARSFCRVVA